MKTQNVKVLFSAAIVLLMAWAFTSCKKSDTVAPVVANTTALQTALDTANKYLTTAVEGNAAGDYTVGSKATLQGVTTSAQAVFATSGVTQTAVDAATTALDAAIAAFKLAVIAPIDPADLIVYFKFDDGSGTTTADASSNKRVGTLTAGTPTLAGPAPTWVADRAGTAGKALHFTAGGHIEVPASSDFIPNSITISAWVNLDSASAVADPKTGIYGDNYIISQNDYHSYKFQTQTAAKPFFTVNTSSTGTYINQDTNNAEDAPKADNLRPSLYLKRWYYIAVTFTTNNLSFYINGVLVKAYTDPNVISGTIFPGSPNDLFCVGQGSSNAFFAAQANPPDYVVPHFEGSIDELRMYKSALSAAQIQSIYNQEKP